MAVENAADKKPLLPRLGRIIFRRRLLAGLVVLLVGALVIRERHPYGEHELLGKLLSGLLLALGLGIRVWAGGSAGNHTRAGALVVPQLATGGPFAYVRNPIYLGTVILSIGMIGLVGDLWMLAVLPGFLLVYALLIPAEEEYLRRQFGAEYEAYCGHVRRLLPRRTPWPGRTERPFDWHVLRGEAWIAVYLLLIYAGMSLAGQWRG
jgi:protein-S-isoprenylcysteine O-methyltransferase Ste14